MTRQPALAGSQKEEPLLKQGEVFLDGGAFGGRDIWEIMTHKENMPPHFTASDLR